MVRFYQGSDMVLYSFLGQAVYKQFFCVLFAFWFPLLMSAI
jgi:hypothetical protein